MCIRDRLSPARIKYPMKRKNIRLDNPQGELRGKDEWERISWDEALALVAEGIKKMYDQYGPTGILCGAVSYTHLDVYKRQACHDRQQSARDVQRREPVHLVPS